jgi:hypothetical protein
MVSLKFDEINMKKKYHLFIFVICTFFCNIVSVKGQAGCDMNLIRSALFGVGVNELTSSLSSCSMCLSNPLSQTVSAAQSLAQNYSDETYFYAICTENACTISDLIGMHWD